VSAASIMAVGAVSSVGTSALQTFTSVRAGIVRMHATSVLDRAAAPVVMGRVPERHLPPLADGLAARASLPTRHARMLRLARGAHDDAAAAARDTRDVPLYLGVHEPAPGRPPPDAGRVLDALAEQCPGMFARARSHVFPGGRAAAFAALHRALADMASGAVERAWVGGADSYMDALALATLDRDERLKTAQRADGFRPGEGAAFVLLARGAPGGALCELAGAGVGIENGHLGSDAPMLGDGLSDAVRDALAGAAGVRTALTGLNGESQGAKEWGVAARRSARAFAQDMDVVHPAECYGDPGAACGALLLTLGAVGLARGVYAGDVLAWSASDGPARGAALLRRRATEA
jgi:3-oxoacyl-[acyl-carrier-protein] synthase-1